ncbi:MAG: hypothetical protein CYG60_05245 [Actinobacteria bacterium]|nr:MAG: hypothetical protein CYG60_05245 [Actinomycetota bacterium]
MRRMILVVTVAAVMAAVMAVAGPALAFIRNPNQPDRLAAKLRRVGWSRSGHLLSFRQTSGTQSPSVHPTVASPLAES